MQIIRTTSENPDFLQLVKELDCYLAMRNGESDAFFAQFNKVDLLQHVVVVYQDKQVVGCGAMKDQEGKMELKKMFVQEKFRNQGIASKILKELESWAKEIGYNRTILETGKHMEDAVGLYQKNGYQIIPNYGQYVDVESSVCMEKIL